MEEPRFHAGLASVARGTALVTESRLARGGLDAGAARSDMRFDDRVRDTAAHLRLSLLLAPRALLPVPPPRLGRLHAVQGLKLVDVLVLQVGSVELHHRGGADRGRRLHAGRRLRLSLGLSAEPAAHPGRHRRRGGAGLRQPRSAPPRKGSVWWAWAWASCRSPRACCSGRRATVPPATAASGSWPASSPCGASTASRSSS